MIALAAFPPNGARAGLPAFLWLWPRESCRARRVAMAMPIVVASSGDSPSKNEQQVRIWVESHVERFLKKMPKPIKSSKTCENARAAIDFNVMQSGIKLLMNDPNKILPTLGSLQSTAY